jgi:hypothetical protein
MQISPCRFLREEKRKTPGEGVVEKRERILTRERNKLGKPVLRGARGGHGNAG